MFLFRRDHPLLRGCRLFYKPDNLKFGTNLGYGGGAPGTVVGTSLAARYGVGSTLVLSGSGTGLTFGTPAALKLGGPGVTILARCRVGTNGAISGSSTTYAVAESIQGPLDSGFSLFWNQDGFGNYGYNFGVYKTGDYYVCNALGTNQLGRDVVVAGVYDPTVHTPLLYVNGVELGHTNFLSSSGSPTGITWDVTSTSPLKLGWDGSAKNLVGEIAWVMVFDRTLARAEIQAISDDGSWPFYEDDDWMYADGTVTYRNVVGVGQAFSGQPAGAVTYSNTVLASAFVGGDIVINPASSSIPTYRNVVAVGQHYFPGSPVLVRYKNVVAVGQVATLGSPVTYRNVVGVGQKYHSRLDGRLDLLGTARYRR